MRVAVIPARGGSKRIPRKNVRSFAGKPLIAYSINCAIDSGVFDRIIISTDDQEIAALAIDFGGEVPFMRPAELADDHTGTTEVIAHTVEWMRAQGSSPSAVCCIYATAPFIRSEDVCQGLKILEEGGWQYVFSATTFASSIFRSFQLSSERGVEMFFPENFSTRSQDLPDALHDAAQFYWGRSQAWADKARVFDKFSTIVKIPRWRVQDIDTEEDWIRAELMAGEMARLDSWERGSQAGVPI